MSLSNLIRQVGRQSESGDNLVSDDDMMDIIEFVESPAGLKFSQELSGSSLFPVQKFILKMYYNLPLDDQDPYIRIPKSWRHVGSTIPGSYYEFTEVQYLEYLHNEGRCNIKEQDHDRRILILPIGRRSGKSTISAMIAAYETYKLLRKYNPQKYYGTPEGAPIQICSLATARDQAAILYKEVRRHFNNSDFFKQYLASETQTQALFHTPQDLDNEAAPSVRLTFYSAVAKGIRGAANIVAIMDEVAFFATNGQGSAKEIWQALSPSLAQFSPKDPDDPQKPIGDSHGRTIMISSPYAREGLFYEMYEMSFAGNKAAKKILTIQAPTWEVNPTIPLDYFEGEFEQNPIAFITEFGAEFTDKVKSWIERDEDLISNVDPHLKPQTKARPRERHFLGFDLAPRGDRTVVVLTKLVDDKIQLVYHEQWQAKTDWYEINPHLKEPFPEIAEYAKNMHAVETLDYDMLCEWLYAISKKFFITEGVFDRYEGIGLEQRLHKMGLSQLKMKRFQPAETSEVFQNFKMLMLQESLILYDYVVEDDDPLLQRQGYSPYLQELLELQSTARGKYLLRVEAPQIKGKHDDFADALTRSIWLASERLNKRKGGARTSANPNAPDHVRMPRSATEYHRRRARMNNIYSKRNPKGRGR